MNNESNNVISKDLSSSAIQNNNRMRAFWLVQKHVGSDSTTFLLPQKSTGRSTVLFCSFLLFQTFTHYNNPFYYLDYKEI